MVQSEDSSSSESLSSETPSSGFLSPDSLSPDSLTSAGGRFRTKNGLLPSSSSTSFGGWNVTATALFLFFVMYSSNKDLYVSYNISSIGCHIGNLNSGHYYAICKNEDGENFIKYDDMNINIYNKDNCNFLNDNKDCYMITYSI